MISGFIYEWTDTRTGLKYVGRHEGSPTDGYIGSGTIFIKEYNKRPRDFIRKLLWESDNTTLDELKSKEEAHLDAIPDTELYYGSNKKYYNQVRNSSGYTSEDNPMNSPEVIARMIATRKRLNLNNPYQNSLLKYGEAELCKMQSDRAKGNTYGSGNKGKPKSAEHKRNISDSIRRLAADPTTNVGKSGGRKPAMPVEETLAIYNQYGVTGGAKYLNINRDAFYSRVLTAKRKLTL